MVDDLRIIPERDEPRARAQSNRPGGAKPTKKRPPPPKKPSGSSPLVVVLCIMVILVSGAAAYLYLQTQTLSEQRADLDDRVKVLESKLSVTDESLSESGAAMQAVLQGQGEDLELHMSEIRKLWAVAYDTNRPKLEELEKNQASQSARINSVRDSLSKIEPQVSNLESLKSRVDTAANQSLALSAGFDEIEAGLRAVTDSLSAIETSANAQGRSIDEHSEAIEAIDQYRIQINQRVLQLENQLRSGTP